MLVRFFLLFARFLDYRVERRPLCPTLACCFARVCVQSKNEPTIAASKLACTHSHRRCDWRARTHTRTQTYALRPGPDGRAQLLPFPRDDFFPSPCEDRMKFFPSRGRPPHYAPMGIRRALPRCVQARDRSANCATRVRSTF